MLLPASAADRQGPPVAAPQRARKGDFTLLVLLVIVLVPTLLLCYLEGAGRAALLGAFVALFVLIAGFGGSLRADLRVMSLLGPVTAISAVAPRMLAQESRAGAIVVITLLIFVANLLPLRGPRYASVSLGWGMGTLLGYSVPLPAATNAQLMTATATGLLVALLLRTAFGAADPHRATREGIANIFTAPEPEVGGAVVTWVRDRRTAWLGECLVAAGRYRTALHTLNKVDSLTPAAERAPLREYVAWAERQAAHAAQLIRAKTASTGADAQFEVTPAPGLGEDEGLTPQVRIAALGVRQSLDSALRAAQRRNDHSIPVPANVQLQLGAALTGALLHGRSRQRRHAVRTAVAVLVALVLSLRLSVGDPLLATLLMTTFGLLQISWLETLQRVRSRLVGLCLGALVVVAAMAALPPGFLLPIAVSALGVGLYYMLARPALSAAAMVVVSVGVNASTRHLDPLHLLIEFAALTLIAVLIAVGVGCLAIPEPPVAPLVVRLHAATSACVAVLRYLSPEPDGTWKNPLRALRLAEVSISELTLPGDETAQVRAALVRLGASLRGLMTTSVFVSTTLTEVNPHSSSFALAAAILADEVSLSALPPESPMEGMLVLAAQDARAALSDLDSLSSK